MYLGTIAQGSKKVALKIDTIIEKETIRESSFEREREWSKGLVARLAG